MKKLIIKIGANMMEDVKKAFFEPSEKNLGTHTLYLKKPQELHEILSPQRFLLLSHLINEKETKSVSELAKQLGRKQEAISRDLKILERHNMVKKTRKKTTIYAKPNFYSIIIELKES